MSEAKKTVIDDISARQAGPRRMNLRILITSLALAALAGVILWALLV